VSDDPKQLLSPLVSFLIRPQPFSPETFALHSFANACLLALRNHTRRSGIDAPEDMTEARIWIPGDDIGRFLWFKFTEGVCGSPV
jgi:hypothetical protein